MHRVLPAQCLKHSRCPAGAKEARVQQIEIFDVHRTATLRGPQNVVPVKPGH